MHKEITAQVQTPGKSITHAAPSAILDFTHDRQEHYVGIYSGIILRGARRPAGAREDHRDAGRDRLGTMKPLVIFLAAALCACATKAPKSSTVAPVVNGEAYGNQGHPRSWWTPARTAEHYRKLHGPPRPLPPAAWEPGATPEQRAAFLAAGAALLEAREAQQQQWQQYLLQQQYINQQCQITNELRGINRNLRNIYWEMW